MIHPAKMYVTEKRPPMQAKLKSPAPRRIGRADSMSGEFSTSKLLSEFHSTFAAGVRQDKQPPPVWAILHRFDGLLVSYKKMPMLARLNPSISRGLENTKTATLARIAVLCPHTSLPVHIGGEGGLACRCVKRRTSSFRILLYHILSFHSHTFCTKEKVIL